MLHTRRQAFILSQAETEPLLTPCDSQMFALGAGTPEFRVGTGARDADAEGDDATTHPFANSKSLLISIPDGIDVEALAIKYELSREVCLISSKLLPIVDRKYPNLFFFPYSVRSVSQDADDGRRVSRHSHRHRHRRRRGARKRHPSS